MKEEIQNRYTLHLNDLNREIFKDVELVERCTKSTKTIKIKIRKKLVRKNKFFIKQNRC